AQFQLSFLSHHYQAQQQFWAQLISKEQNHLHLLPLNCLLPPILKILHQRQHHLCLITMNHLHRLLLLPPNPIRPLHRRLLIPLLRVSNLRLE
ncbi:predicted protein, partial [Arabidopsis lyrata subsp. lyrata]